MAASCLQKSASWLVNSDWSSDTVQYNITESYGLHPAAKNPLYRLINRIVFRILSDEQLTNFFSLTKTNF